MKYTRLEIYKGISNSKLKVLLSFFIVIPVIAVLAGGIITRTFISNNKQINFTTAEDKSEVAVSTSTTLNYKILSLQVGAFASKNNADTLSRAIKSDNIEPIVIEDNNIYRVIISLSDNQEFITQKKDKLQNQGYNCLVNEFVFASIEEADNEGIEKTNKIITTSIDIIKLQLKLNDEFSQTSTINLEALNEYTADLNDDYTELTKFNSSNALKIFKSNFEQFINDYKKAAENKDLNLCRKITGQQVFLLKDFYKEVLQSTIK